MLFKQNAELKKSQGKKNKRFILGRKLELLDVCAWPETLDKRVVVQVAVGACVQRKIKQHILVP
jgi:hypothetical protein